MLQTALLTVGGDFVARMHFYICNRQSPAQPRRSPRCCPWHGLSVFALLLGALVSRLPVVWCICKSSCHACWSVSCGPPIQASELESKRDIGSAGLGYMAVDGPSLLPYGSISPVLPVIFSSHSLKANSGAAPAHPAAESTRRPHTSAGGDGIQSELRRLACWSSGSLRGRQLGGEAASRTYLEVLQATHGCL